MIWMDGLQYGSGHLTSLRFQMIKITNRQMKGISKSPSSLHDGTTSEKLHKANYCILKRKRVEPNKSTFASMFLISQCILTHKCVFLKLWKNVRILSATFPIVL